MWVDFAGDHLLLIRALDRLQGESCRALDREPSEGVQTATHAHGPVVTATRDRVEATWLTARLSESPPKEGARVGLLEHAIHSADADRHADGWQLASPRSETVCRHRLDGLPALIPVQPAQQVILEDWLDSAPTSFPVAEEDIEQLRQLKARYFRTMDCRMWKEFEQVFAPDAVFDIRGELLDTAGWCQMVEDFLDGGLSIHHGHTPEFAGVDVDTVRGVWTLTDYLEWPQPHGRRAVRGYGHYEEEYRRTSRGWVISKLRLSYLRFDELPGPRVNPSALRVVDHGAWLDGWGLPSERSRDTFAIVQLRYGADLEDASAGTVVHSHMPEVRFRGNYRARAIWSQLRHRHLSADGQSYVDEYGYLHEEYVLGRQGWEVLESVWLPSRHDVLEGDALIGSTPFDH